VEVHWVTRGERAPYSGMLAGWVAGEYPSQACIVELSALARAAQVVLHPGGAVGLDAGRRAVALAEGAVLEADVLSVGLGSALQGEELPGVRAHALDVKNLMGQTARFSGEGRRWVVVGGGLGGVELALCLAVTSRDVSLVTESEPFPKDGPVALGGAVRRALRRRGVPVVLGRAVGVTQESVRLADGRSIPATGVLWATGPAPHPLLADSGLALGPTGAVRVEDTLQSTSHPKVFAAGDCADLATPVPKSGVYSVREAPVLWRNLVAALRGQSLGAYRPQRYALALVNCGDGTALLSFGPFAGRARLFRRWKHRLDTAFLASLRPPSGL
jgi:NADH dehydrogenase FAD-containing subunit